MLHRFCAVVALFALLAVAGQPFAADSTDLLGSLKTATVELKSAGPLAFGSQGILFIGDPAAATIYAIDTGDRLKPETSDRPKVEGIDEKVASLLGVESKDVAIKDLAVNPISGNTYLSVARGSGPKASPMIMKVTRAGKLSEVSLKDIKSASAMLPNAAKGGKAQEAITHMAYLKGRLLVAGMSNEKFSSNLRSIPFPFDKTDTGSSVGIFHGAHGRFETASPIRVFTTYQIGGEDNLLAAYQCTPLVKLPVNTLKPGEQIKGVTVAELGNRNRPLSIIVYQKGGKDYALIANSSRGVMKVKLEGVDKAEGINKRIADTAGLKYETVKDLKGVQKLDAFDKDHAILLVKSSEGKTSLETVELP